MLGTICFNWSALEFLVRTTVEAIAADTGATDLLPEVDFIDKPDPLVNNAGVKGLGEVAMIGVAGAITNAVHHATSRRLRDLPIRIEHLL